MANYIMSAFADEYGSSLDKQIEGLKKNGIEYIELRFVDGVNVADLTKEQAKSVKEKLDEAGIKVSAIGSPLGKSNISDDFSLELEKAERVFENAVIFGAKNIRMFSFYFPGGKTRAEVREEVLTRVEALLDLADKYSLTLCHENEAKIYGESDDHCLDLLRYFGGRLKAVFDMGNFTLDGVNALTAYEKLSGYIEYFHIKDALKAGAIVPAGKGEASVKEILEKYQSDYGKRTFITLEPHLQTFSGLNALVGKSFDNPYKFETQEEAFDTAVKELRSLL